MSKNKYQQLDDNQALSQGDEELVPCSLGDARERILHHDAFVFDLDGTLYLGAQPIDGAVRFIARLREMGKKVFFVTNNSSKSVAEYLSKLSALGFEPQIHEIVTSTHATISWLKQQNYKAPFVVGTPALIDSLRDCGFQVDSPDHDVVVLGFDRTFTFGKMVRACELVCNGVPYVATHPDFYCPTDMGPEPDCGTLIEMVRLTTKIGPAWVGGKPSKTMIDEISARVGSMKGMIFFGDRLYTDMQMAKNAGIPGVLVLSGETTLMDLQDAEAKKLPHFVLNSVKDLC